MPAHWLSLFKVVVGLQGLLVDGAVTFSGDMSLLKESQEGEVDVLKVL